MTKSREHERELQIYLYSFLNATLYGSKSSSSRPNCRNPKIEPSTYFIGGLMGLKTDLGFMEKINTSCLCWNSNPGKCKVLRKYRFKKKYVLRDGAIKFSPEGLF